MLSDYFKCRVFPDAIARHAQNYTIDGLIVWKNLSFTHMAFVERGFGQKDAVIQDALQDPDKAILLNVNQGQHWVVAIKKTLLGKDYVCADPWTGKTCQAIRDYHDITGYALFKRV